MAAISAVTVSSLDQRNAVVSDKDKRVKATIAFGNGVDTYPVGGIPVDKALFGFRQEIRSILMSDAESGDGFVYKFDDANKKILIYQAEYTAVADGALIELDALAVPAATALVCEVVGR